MEGRMVPDAYTEYSPTDPRYDNLIPWLRFGAESVHKCQLFGARLFGSSSCFENGSILYPLLYRTASLMRTFAK